MAIRTKKGDVSWTNLIFGLLIALIIAAVLIFIIGKTGKTGNNLLGECQGMGGGVWSPNPCNPSVSVESFLVERVEYKGKLQYCCVPLPGKSDAFYVVYENVSKSDINKYGTDGTVKKTGDSASSTSSTNSGTTTTQQGDVSVEGPIHFILNGREISHASTRIYTAGMQTNGLMYSRAKQTFKVSQSLSNNGVDVGRCMIVVRPAMVYDSDGQKKIKANTGAPENYVTKVDLAQCEDSISATDVILPLLSGDYAVPGFYKWDFIYWKKGSTAVDGDGSATTYLTLVEGSAPSSGSNGGDTGENTGGDENGSSELTLEIYDSVISARDNKAICYFSAVVVDENWNEYFPEHAYYEVTNSINPPTQYTNVFPENSVVIDIGPNDYLHYSFGINDGDALEERYFDFENCDEVSFLTMDDYRNDVMNCAGQALVCDYTKKSYCTHPPERPNYCTKLFEDCLWDAAFPVGDCFICSNDHVTTCADYDNAKTCESNQCQGVGQMNDRCFYQDGSCRSCNYGVQSPNSCASYDNKDDCKNDPCNFNGFLGKTCKWESGACTIVQ